MSEVYLTTAQWEARYPGFILPTGWDNSDPEVITELEFLNRLRGHPGYVHQIRVVCAAMLMTDGFVVSGVRHFSPDMRATLTRLYGMEYKYQVQEQGFIDNHGNWLTRAEAWRVAEAAGQIRRTVGGNPAELFSENLY